MSNLIFDEDYIAKYLDSKIIDKINLKDEYFLINSKEILIDEFISKNQIINLNFKLGEISKEQLQI